MMTRKKSSVLLFVLGLGIACGRAAQQPRMANAKMEMRSATGGLEKEFRSLVQAQGRPAWIGYAVPVVAGNHTMCCCDSGHYATSRGGCSLEGDHEFSMNSEDSKQADLEGPNHFWVLMRVAERRVERIRTFSEDCELNAGGLQLFWLTDVKPADSVALLSSMVGESRSEERDDERLGSGAMAAIALTNDPAADRALDQFAASVQPESLREKAAFWLGSARGRHGYEILKTLIHNDADERFRRHATFCLSVSRQPEAVATLIDVAKNDQAGGVRSQALFWLAQKAGKRAEGAITDAIDNDPETGVKKQAVFVLTQIPKDEGVPMLIHVARTNRNREVRKQAMFWLGQSNDPRALAFFEEVLLR
jgi:HEAT repeat protein